MTQTIEIPTDTPSVLGAPTRGIPVAELGASPLAKAMVKAFNYHPYGLNSIVFTDNGWACGPTFIVRCDEDVSTWVSLTQGYDLYQEGVFEGPLLSRIPKDEMRLLLDFDYIEKIGKQCDEPLSLDSKGHPRAPKTRRDKFGADQVQSGGNCTCRALRPLEGPVSLELAFPLVALQKRIGTTEIRGFDPSVVKIFASTTEKPVFPYTMSEIVVCYKGEEQVGMLAAKRIGDDCVI